LIEGFSTLKGKNMKDDIYRKYCCYPKDYDRLIDVIARVNPAARRSSDPESWAADAVHNCIRTIVFGGGGKDSSFCSTGGAMATRGSQDPTSPSYKLVVLSLASLTQLDFGGLDTR